MPLVQKTLLTLLAVATVAFPEPRLSVRDIMESALTPATNTLWGALEPQTDEDWQHLDNAAVVVIASMSLVGQGGSGPSDADWSAEPEWRSWTREVIEAAEAARRAIASRNIEALLDATDVMYPPCEACHIRFHTGVE